MKDNYNTGTSTHGWVAAVATSDVTPIAIDRAGFESVTFHAYVGVGGITFDDTNKLALKMEHSDNGSDWTACALADVLGAASVTSGVVKEWTAAKAAASVHSFGYIGGKRYSRMTADFSGTHGAGTAVACVVVKGHPEISPAVA